MAWAIVLCMLTVVSVARAATMHPGTATGQPATTSLQVHIPGGEFASSSLIKVPRYSAGTAVGAMPDTLHLSSVRNAQVSAQLVVAGTPALDDLHATVSALKSDRGARISASDTRVRYVGYVPVEAHDPRVGGATVAEVNGGSVSKHDGRRVVADPLLARPSVDVPQGAAQPIWFTFHVPASIPPGTYRGHITITAKHAKTRRYPIELTVHQPVLPDSGDGDFRLNVWFNPDAVATAYHVEPWSPAHWTLLKRYFRFLADAGQRMILTTIVPHPWRVGWNDWKPQTATGYDSMVQWSYDGKQWHFDFSRFDRYVRTARKAGLGPDISAYSMLAFRGPQRLTWLDTRTNTVKKRTLKVSSPFWRHAWCAFMKDFSAHLEQRGWLDHTWLGFDERPADIINPAMQVLKNAHRHSCTAH